MNERASVRSAWAHLLYGLERPRQPLLEQGISDADLQQVFHCLADPARMVTGPPVLCAYGRR